MNSKSFSTHFSNPSNRNFSSSSRTHTRSLIKFRVAVFMTCLFIADRILYLPSLKKTRSFILVLAMYINIELPSTKAMISAVATTVATAVAIVTAAATLLSSLSRDLIPGALRHYISNELNNFVSTFTQETALIIDEYEELNKNQLFHAANLYLSTLTTPSNKVYHASIPKTKENIHISAGEENEEFSDEFDCVRLKWSMVHKINQGWHHDDHHHSPSMKKVEVKSLVLTFHRKHKTKVFNEYLPYVVERSKFLKQEKKTLKLHTLRNDRVHGHGGSTTNPWQSVDLYHPAKFETLAMDNEIKKMIMDDLDKFSKSKELYRQVGKAWKRGYLLFGPPGTGKSSLIAAMANYLKFDVYDLELADVKCSSDLRRLLISTKNRSILVVEDIDASIDLTQRIKTAPKPPRAKHPSYEYDEGPKVTLSGLVSFIDGLWSSCGEEQIIIFTTNHKEKLDPALLRPGRMDIHIHMSYCTPSSFKMLVWNYLKIIYHPLALEAEKLIASTNVTPAEVGEQLLKGSDPELVLRGLIKFIERKKESEMVKLESVEVTTEVDVTKRTENGESSQGLKELVKTSKRSSSQKTLKKGEAANALRILIHLLEKETGEEM